ncbi:FAD-dependent oxidoreductase [Oscillospiraceae bacterium HV4-5-C5C]|nr:FAD-dependent oxidoreductase [Oscillospiraceae bacterium HV4-5-C5C]
MPSFQPQSEPQPAAPIHQAPLEELDYDVVVAGGGLSGLCAALASARGGARTALLHNRPVLGGNASSEIRMHICGADCHMSRPEARETGILEEILLEHKHRNPGNSWAIFDSILWEKARFQPGLELMLNTQLTAVQTRPAANDQQLISSVQAIQLTSERRFRLSARQFIDATGDATLGYLAGARYMYGRESAGQFDEGDAPRTADACTMGSSLLFKAKDLGQPVPFICPSWAYHFTEDDLKNRGHSELTSGYWWIELGGQTEHIIHDAEAIRDELLKTLFGVWDHIKNSGCHPQSADLDLEWVGFLPGKRESRRLLGDYVLTESDCLSARRFPDAVAYGGWPLDVHVVSGFSDRQQAPTVYIDLPDVYTIPFRCLYSQNVQNLFIAGRAISATHLAFASTRVMGTCAVVGQAVGTAAALCIQRESVPRALPEAAIRQLQQQLLKDDAYIPGLTNQDPLDLLQQPGIQVSASCQAEQAAQVLNGTTRPVGRSHNCWQADQPNGAWLSFHFPQPVTISTVQLTFDSNLSREIMISLSEQVLARQENHSPSELVKDYELTFFKGAQVLLQIDKKDNYQRHCAVRLPQPLTCDRLQITIHTTHGTLTPRIFEVRAYG